MDGSPTTTTHHFYPFKCTCNVQILINLSAFLQSLAYSTPYCRQQQLEIERMHSSTSSNMKNQLHELVSVIPISCQYDYRPSPSGAIIPKKMDSMNHRMNRNRKKADNFVDGVREHLRLGLKFSETVKGKLSLGAKILQQGGVKRVFRQNFGAREGEKLLKVSQCYLSTTAGPIAGLLFISTQRVAFCSERSIKFSAPNGELIRIHYKVSIPVRKIKRANQSENMKNPSQKFMEIVTVDNFEFWFMGFLNYHKAFGYLRQAIPQVQNPVQK